MMQKVGKGVVHCHATPSFLENTTIPNKAHQHPLRPSPVLDISPLSKTPSVTLYESEIGILKLSCDNK